MYLNRSERTVRRWEAREELPVHRLQHDKRGSVYAYARELDAWRTSRRLTADGAEDRPASRHTSRRLVVGLASLTVLVVTAAAWSWPSGAADPRGTSNDEAWRVFQRARFGLNAGRVQIETGIRYYQQAIELDPKFARAWAGLATAHVALTWFGERPLTDTMAQARREAEHDESSIRR